MTGKTRNVVSHDYSIADLELGHITPCLDHFTGNFVAQNHRLIQLLKSDLVNIRETNPAGLDLKQQIPLLKRWSGNFLDSRLMVLGNDGFHRELWRLFTLDQLGSIPRSGGLQTADLITTVVCKPSLLGATGQDGFEGQNAWLGCQDGTGLLP
jgi:hypothetical protein